MDIEAEEQATNPPDQDASIVKLWRRNHKVFKGKYSSGATPKTHRYTAKMPNTGRKTHLNFSSNETPKRRLDLCQLIKKEMDLPSTAVKKISNIEEEEYEGMTGYHSKRYVFRTPEKKTSQNNTDHDKSLKDSYEKSKHRLHDYDEYHSRFYTDYEYVGTLGSGCFGVVKKCRNKVDGLIYAIKIMKPFQKNLNEVKALASLSNIECGNIVRYHNSWIENSRLFMVMEYCYKSLKAMLDYRRQSNTPFFEKYIKSILFDILHALESLHYNHIVHLDIKPYNILLSVSGKFKLGDLGMCRVAEVARGEDVNEGDSKYLAKEILRNLSQGELPDLTKADIFSLGMTLYELVTGETLPNTGQRWHELREGSNLVNSLIPYEQQYSVRLLQLIIQMVDEVPSNRPSASQLLQKPYFYNLYRPVQRQVALSPEPVRSLRRLSF